MNWSPRLARNEDIPALEPLIVISVHTLQSPYYSPAQMTAALGPVFSIDLQLIKDGTYFVVESEGTIIGCGGWSKRSALFGGGSTALPATTELNPQRDAARIRAFFVHPHWSRQGIGRSILIACEDAIVKAGFRKAELVATLAGEPLYAAAGFLAEERYEIPLANELSLPVVRMTKCFKAD